jgi:hypothetical protein
MGALQLGNENSTYWNSEPGIEDVFDTYRWGDQLSDKPERGTSEEERAPALGIRGEPQTRVFNAQLFLI